MKRKYKSYTARKLKLPKRLLFFGVCAIIFFLFAIILGNRLQDKLENTDIDKNPIETSVDISDKNEEGIRDGDAVHSDAYESTKAYCIKIARDTDVSKIKSEINSLLGKYNAISLTIVENSRLTYASKVAEEHSRLDSSEAIASMEQLADIIAHAKMKGFAVSAIYEKSEDTLLDSEMAGELADLGFTEIIICGYENLLGKSGGEISSCLDYLRAIRDSAKGAAISLSLSHEAYSYARNSYQIEKLFTYTEFLSVNMTAVDSETFENFVSNYTGSFSAYSLRPIISGDSNYAELLASNNIATLQYATPIPPAAEDTTTAED